MIFSKSTIYEETLIKSTFQYGRNKTKISNNDETCSMYYVWSQFAGRLEADSEEYDFEDMYPKQSKTHCENITPNMAAKSHDQCPPSKNLKCPAYQEANT